MDEYDVAIMYGSRDRSLFPSPLSTLAPWSPSSIMCQPHDMTPVDYRDMEKFGIKNDPIFTFVEAPPIYPPHGDKCIDHIESHEDQTVFVQEDEVDTAVETGDMESDHIENTEVDQVDVQAVETGDIDMGQIEQKKPKTDTTDNTDKTTTNPHKCDECVKTYKHKKDLDSHKRNHHADQDAEWVVDKKQKDKEARAKRIARQEHTCDLCPSTFGTNQNLKRHRLRFHIERSGGGCTKESNE